MTLPALISTPEASVTSASPTPIVILPACLPDVASPVLTSMSPEGTAFSSTAGNVVSTRAPPCSGLIRISPACILSDFPLDISIVPPVPKAESPAVRAIVPGIVASPV